MTRQIRKLSKQKYYTSATIPKYYTYRLNFLLKFKPEVFRTSRSLIIRTWDGERYTGKWVWFLSMKNFIVIDKPNTISRHLNRNDIAYWKYEIW